MFGFNFKSSAYAMGFGLLLSACGGSSGVGSLNSLSQIPETSQMVATSDTVSASLFRAAFSGTPPALSTLTSDTAGDYFWRDGILDALDGDPATADQCNEFWGGDSTDGTSGGFGACFMAQNVSRSFQSATAPAICYMKKTPTQANLDAGGLVLDDGAFDNNDPTTLFETPSGSTERVVKIKTRNDTNCDDCDQDIYIVVRSTSFNSENDMQYSADLWMCDPDQSSGSPNSKELIRVAKTGALTYARASGRDSEVEEMTLTAFLKQQSGNIVFDKTKSRVASGEGSNSYGDFKFNVEITADNQIILKSYDDQVRDNAVRKYYSISNFDGDDVFSVQFQDGAFKESEVSDVGTYSRTGGIEFRDTVYLNAPNNSLVSGLSAIDFTDSFYTAAPAPSIEGELDGFECGSEASITVTMDMSNETLLEATADCDGNNGLNGDFCWDGDSPQGLAAFFWEASCTTP